MGLTVSLGKWLMLIKAWVTSLSTTEDSLTRGDGGGEGRGGERRGGEGRGEEGMEEGEGRGGERRGWRRGTEEERWHYLHMAMSCAEQLTSVPGHRQPPVIVSGRGACSSQQTATPVQTGRRRFHTVDFISWHTAVLTFHPWNAPSPPTPAGLDL